MHDNLMYARWKIEGVQCLLQEMQTSDMFKGTPEENAFFVLAEELRQAKVLLDEVEKDVG